MQFLLERLATVTSPATGKPEPFDLETAVAAQIQRIVSSRPATNDAQIDLLDFGMQHPVELAYNSRSQLEAYARKLAGLIEHYEPRLRQPTVRMEPNDDPLQPFRLVVSGMLATDAEPHTFRFDLPAH